MSNMPSELITSAQNPKVKRLLALQKDSSLRRESGLFVVEGRRELEHCLDAGFEVDSVFVCPSLHGLWRAKSLPGNGADTRIFEVSPQVYEKVAYRGGTEGVIAEVRARQRRLEDQRLTPSDEMEETLMLATRTAEGRRRRLNSSCPSLSASSKIRKARVCSVSPGAKDTRVTELFST